MCVPAFKIPVCASALVGGEAGEEGGVVEDVLPLQHFITFSFLATLPELPLPFPLQLALSGQCDQSVPPCALCKHVPVYS